MAATACEVGDFEGRIADRFAEKRAGFAVDGAGEVCGITGIHKADLNAEGGQDIGELRVGAAVEIAGGDDVIASGPD